MVSETRDVDFVNDAKLPLSRRVGGQLASFAAVMVAYNADAPADRSATLGGIPAMVDMIKAGVGAFLR